MGSLRERGVGVVEGLVSQELVSDVKATAAYHDMPRHVIPALAGQRPSKHWRLSARGRWHLREEAFEATELHELMSRVEARIWPLVVAFFEEDEERMQGLFRSECQLMNGVPKCSSQTWHADNRSRGLSIIVPLVDFTADNGGTQMLVGSHNSSWSLVAQEGAQVVHAPAGAVVAYDSRTYHRGLSNQTGEGRPGLIFCYDRTVSPPPGVGPLGSLANANLAHVLNVLSTGWIACASMLRGGEEPVVGSNRVV